MDSEAGQFGPFPVRNKDRNKDWKQRLIEDITRTFEALQFDWE